MFSFKYINSHSLAPILNDKRTIQSFSKVGLKHFEDLQERMPRSEVIPPYGASYSLFLSRRVSVVFVKVQVFALQVMY